MPKLLVFAPCEKVIISQDENNPTLIAIMSGLSLQTDAEQLRKAIGEVSTDTSVAMAPIRWSVFTLWSREASDDGKEFTQTIDIESPEHKKVITNRAVFSFPGITTTHRIALHFPGFPVRDQGTYIIRLSLDGENIADYPLELKLEQ